MHWKEFINFEETQKNCLKQFHKHKNAVNNKIKKELILNLTIKTEII